MIKKYSLDLNDAKRMAQAAENLAIAQGWHLSIAIVDSGGHTILLHRMDGATLASADIALDKARSALSYGTSTSNFEQGVAAGKTGLLVLPNIVAFEGGLPVEIDGQLAGGVGASGALGYEDGKAAKTACESL